MSLNSHFEAVNRTRSIEQNDDSPFSKAIKNNGRCVASRRRPRVLRTCGPQGRSQRSWGLTRKACFASQYPRASKDVSASYGTDKVTTFAGAFAGAISADKLRK